MKPRVIISVCVIALIAASRLNAAETDGGQLRESRWKVTDGENQIFTRVGIDPALGFALGYGREFAFFNTGHNWILQGELSTPFATFGQSGAFKPGVYLPVVRYRLFRFSTEVSFKVGWTRNRNYNSVRLAPGLTLLPGIGRANGRWYIDGVLGYERAIANHIEHSDYYRDVFYEDAKDGWYEGMAGHFRMGLRVGCRVKRWDLELRASHDRTERFKNTQGSPFTATLGAGIRF